VEGGEGHQFLHGTLAEFAGFHGGVGDSLKHLKFLTAFLTFVLVNRHNKKPPMRIA
jgi:hypothetical protein